MLVGCGGPSGRAGGVWRALASGMRAFVGVSYRKQLDHGWPESITSQARSAQRCRMRCFSLHEAFVKQARDSARQGALRKLVGASWSAQVALRKLHCASCSAQVAPRKLLRASWSVQVAPCKLLCASCSVQVALCKLLCVSCSAQVALGKALCANSSVQVGLRKLLCATCSAQVALRKLLYASCILRRPPADQGGIEPATRRSREQARALALAMTPCNGSLQGLLAMTPCNDSLQ